MLFILFLFCWHMYILMLRTKGARCIGQKIVALCVARNSDMKLAVAEMLPLDTKLFSVTNIAFVIIGSNEMYMLTEKKLLHKNHLKNVCVQTWML